MGKRPERYRTVRDYVHEGEVIWGLKRRPDGRFYAALDPSKTFGKYPEQAIVRFFRWESRAASGALGVPGFEFWRTVFRHLIIDRPCVAAQVLDIPELATRPVLYASSGEWKANQMTMYEDPPPGPLPPTSSDAAAWVGRLRKLDQLKKPAQDESA